MFQCKIGEIISDMSNVFGIADDILVIGYDESGADHDAAVHKVLQCDAVFPCFEIFVSLHCFCF